MISLALLYPLWVIYVGKFYFFCLLSEVSKHQWFGRSRQSFWYIILTLSVHGSKPNLKSPLQWWIISWRKHVHKGAYRFMSVGVQVHQGSCLWGFVSMAVVSAHLLMTCLSKLFPLYYYTEWPGKIHSQLWEDSVTYLVLQWHTVMWNLWYIFTGFWKYIFLSHFQNIY